MRERTDRVAKIKAGLIDPKAEQLDENCRRPIGELVEAFIGRLTGEGRTTKHIKGTRREILAFIAAEGIDSLGDITSTKASSYVERLRRQGMSARSRQRYLTSAKSFTRWACNQGYVASDPLAGMKRPNPATDRRTCRRMLLPDELTRLHEAAEAATDANGLTGHERAMLYSLAIQTGLRASEIASLTKASLHCTSRPHSLSLKLAAPRIGLRLGSTSVKNWPRT